MPILITFRRNVSTNLFRHLLLSAIRSGIGDNALLCSGFFQELFQTSLYQASQEGGLATLIASQGLQLTTLGIHNNNWRPAYVRFCKNLRAAGVSLSPFVTRSLRWHAKVFLYRRGADPLFALIGSSNITRNAFSLSTPFNFETDVALWDWSETALTRALDFGLLETDANVGPHEYIFAPYAPELNQGLTVVERLRHLAEELEAIPRTPLDA